MEMKINGLPRWAIRAAAAVHRSCNPVHHILRHLDVEFAPNNLRTLWSASKDARLDLHQVHAQQVALLSSDGYCADYAQALVRWTAIEDADAAEAEYLRLSAKARDAGVDPQTCAESCRKSVVAQLVQNGIFAPGGEVPHPDTHGWRARAVTSAHVAAYYDHPRPKDQALAGLLNGRASEKEKEKQEADAEADGMLGWLDDEFEYAGKTLSTKEQSVVSRRVVIHVAPTATATASKSGGTDEDIRIKMRGALSQKMQIGPALDRHRIDEIYAELYGEAPWHGRVIEWLWHRHLETLDDPERCAWLPPSLIVGPPGCGKTFMMTRLAELLELPAVRMDMTGALEPWSIAGGAWGWRNAQPGLAVKTILESGYANPFLLLDEVEKAGKSHLGGPLTALLPLLQRETARKYRCPYLEAEVDLSRVTWVMLGNSFAQIGGPLRDRVTIMTARGPEGPEVRQLVERLLGELVADREVIDVAITAMNTGKMSLRRIQRLARDFTAINNRPQLS